ncbi:MAG: lysine--tRNA ligase, partial [Ruminococcaceae bacterium]|nr:lysine--tRNA ligase [Oscillospiraceae bacterium]
MAKFVPQAELSLTDQVKVRRQKLEQLQAEGHDPFAQTKFDVTATTVEVKENFEAMEGQTVRLAG